MKSLARTYIRTRLIVIVVLLSALLIWPNLTTARDPNDPGKGFDYVFYGYSPPYGNGGAGNRGMLLLDIDDANSPRLYPEGSKFKFLADNVAVSGRLDVKSVTEPVKPTFSKLIGMQTNPERFIFTFRGIAEQGNVIIQGNAALEANDLHYLRAVVDAVHDGKRTRYLVNCEAFNCDAP